MSRSLAHPPRLVCCPNVPPIVALPQGLVVSDATTSYADETTGEFGTWFDDPADPEDFTGDGASSYSYAYYPTYIYSYELESYEFIYSFELEDLESYSYEFVDTFERSHSYGYSYSYSYGEEVQPSPDAVQSVTSMDVSEKADQPATIACRLCWVLGCAFYLSRQSELQS